MASPVQALPTPDGITFQEFQEALGRYPALIQAISDTKGAKHGQKTLAELDQFRFAAAPALFGSGKPQRQMELDDIKVLVDWKLRHGKFRPTLMKLVSQNDPSTARSTVREAIAGYRENRDATQAVEGLVRLRGIGPATASLLLAVHDPERAIFFADEAYWWLCSGGRKTPLKYSVREYQGLERAARLRAARLGGVSAVDMERVAFVLMKHEEVAPFAVAAAAAAGTDGVPDPDVIRPLPEIVRKRIGAGRPPAVSRKSSDERKRKQSQSEPQQDTGAAAAAAAAAAASAAWGTTTGEDAGLRRSKRGKRV